MKPNARQRLLGGVLLLAGAVWGIDAFTGDASPAPVAAQTPKPPGTASAGPGWVDVDEALTRLVSRATEESSSEELRIDRDLFRPTPLMEAAYPAPVAELPAAIAEPPPPEEDFAERHRLFAVMLGPTPVAVVDDKLLPLHGELDGFRLVTVERDRAVFRDKSSGRAVELPLVERPQKSGSGTQVPAAAP